MGIKEYMPIEEIKKNILSNYPYNVYDIIPVKFKDTDKQRAVYRFNTNCGPKCLKKVYFNEENLLFVYSVIEWFYRNGIYVPKILPTNSGNRFVKYNNDLFIVTDWIEGRKCDYDIDDDIQKAAANLGKMHKLSYGFIPIKGSFIRKDDFDWYKTLNRRFLQLLQFNNLASKYNDEFSKIYLDYFDYFSNRARHAVVILSHIDNEELAMPAEKHNTICHLDYVNKNLIVTDSGELCVIDFDKSKVDIPIHDIGTFLKRILKRTNTSWDYKILSMVLENYQNERKLTEVEFLGLFAFLEFPQKYWKISRDYFSNRKNCNKKMFISMLSKTCEQMDDHNQFCNQFQDYIEQKQNINLKH